MASPPLHRFPRGETCPDCNARYWYLSEGKRFCRKGHEIEGYVEFDNEEEEKTGASGKTTRRVKEARRRETRQLGAAAGRALYLECLQLVLRRQAQWLVRDRGLPARLEEVVRDLWDLRTRPLEDLRRADEDGDGGGSGGPGHQRRRKGQQQQLFSSQSETEVSDGGASAASAGAGRPHSWRAEGGENWRMPNLVDALGLCYLGCVLLRLPVRVGDLFRWAENNQMPFLEVIERIPENMRVRLPSEYQRTLRGQSVGFRGGELHAAVLELVLSYHSHYELVLPDLNVRAILYKYIRDLALPLEVYLYTLKFIDLLGFRFAFPLAKSRFGLIDHPDVLLLACVVAVSKILCPLEPIEYAPRPTDKTPLFRMDWEAWRKALTGGASSHMSRRRFENITPEMAETLSSAEAHEYMDWVQRTRVPLEQEQTELKKLFPLEDPKPPPIPKEPTEDEMDERIRTVQRRCEVVSPSDNPEPGAGSGRGPQRLLHRYRTPKDLSPNAKAFYDKAAQLAGMSLPKTVRAVSLVEAMLDEAMGRAERETEGSPTH